MTSDSDLRILVAESRAHHRAGRNDTARWKAIFAGVAAVRLSGLDCADIPVPAELSEAPFRAWFDEGVATARAALARAPMARPEPAMRFVVRPGGNAAARSCKEDFDL